MVERFAALAAVYIDFIDTADHSSDSDLSSCRKHLCALHAAAIELPSVELEEEKPAATAHETPPLEDYKRAMTRFKEMPIDSYWEVFDPLKKDEIIMGSLSDDLADIYSDLWKGLRYFRSGNYENAAWEWKFSFEINWGHHLIDAQRVIHSYFARIDE